MAGNQSDLRERKERIIKLLISLIFLQILCLKILPSHKNEIYLMKEVTKLGMFSATYESVTVPASRVRKIWTTLRANQIVGFVTVPSEKKINFDLSDYSSAISISSFPV